jgi:hypothetical protein
VCIEFIKSSVGACYIPVGMYFINVCKKSINQFSQQIQGKLIMKKSAISIPTQRVEKRSLHAVSKKGPPRAKYL